jgi:plasmid replication initiation protein
MPQELQIRQHNALTTARYEYTELQQDLLFFLISRLRKEQQTITYILDIKELSTLTGKRYNAAYLQKATADMGNRVFEVLTENSYEQVWMFRRVKYLMGQGVIEVKLNEDILSYLFDLKDNFTSYGLAAALRLTSKYAKRIYPLCSQWKDVGETKKYDLLNFKKTLGLLDDKGNEKMKQIKELRERVLDIAVKQINEHTELHVSYKLEKQGKAFKSITFMVKPQALAENIPFELLPNVAEDTSAQSVQGVSVHQVENARQLLTQIGIVKPVLVHTILSNATHVTTCNKFAYDLKTGKYAKVHTLSGFLLAILGLK